MNENQEQSQQQTIINSYVYLNKNRSDKKVQYEIKYEGVSYLDTKWVAPNNVSKEAVTKYEQKAAMKQYDDQKNLPQSQLHKQSLRSYTRKPSLLNSTIRCYTTMNPNFKIQIKTHQPKHQNHYIYNDRVIKILKQIYRFKERNLITSKIITKQIQLHLTKQYLNHQYQNKLIQEVYPTFKEIKTMKDKAKFNINPYKIYFTIDIQVLWHDYTTSLVNVQYINDYQPQISRQYHHLRAQIKQKCYSLIKRTSALLVRIPNQIKQTYPIRKRFQITREAQPQQEINKIQIETQRKISLRFNMMQENAKVKKCMQLEKLKYKCEVTHQSKLQSYLKRQISSKAQKKMIFQQQTSEQKSKTIQID